MTDTKQFPASPTDAQVKHMVDRFLGWKLPANFSPDGGVSFSRPNYPASWGLSGTNLLDATQADAMVRHMLDGMPSTASLTDANPNPWPEKLTHYRPIDPTLCGACPQWGGGSCCKAENTETLDYFPASLGTGLTTAEAFARTFMESIGMIDDADDIEADLVKALTTREAEIRASGVVGEIYAERERQKNAEGWTAEHDAQHSRGELAVAAGCYALWHGNRLDMEPEQPHSRGSKWIPKLWPWAAKWWKPKNHRRNLIRAAALIVAEIERLDRADAARPSRRKVVAPPIAPIKAPKDCVAVDVERHKRTLTPSQQPQEER